MPYMKSKIKKEKKREREYWVFQMAIFFFQNGDFFVERPTQYLGQTKPN